MPEGAVRHFILGTAGHVDHGKSALVKALTGSDPDRLPEEKARGITIDLGFAHLRLASRDGDGTLDIGIIDVPGHEDFVRNMVAGVGSLDAAMLVVAADDGWMPQTEEHLQILTYLGVRRFLVALTKIDLVDDPSAAAAAVRQRLCDTPLADAPIIPTSVVSGAGIEAIRSAIAAQLSDLSPATDIGKPRLPIDRAFTLKGIGTVVTGTLIGGRLTRGQQAFAQPAGSSGNSICSRIRSIQCHGEEVDVALPGSRVALNLPDLQVAPAGRHLPSGAICRGLVITATEYRPTHRLCVVLDRSARRAPGRGEEPPPRPLPSGGIVRLHHGSTAIRARLRILDRDTLTRGGRGVAILRTESPLLAFAGDRFILRDDSQRHTLAGGVVLDPLCPFSGKPAAAYLAAAKRAAEGWDPVHLIHLQLARDPLLARDQLLAESSFPLDAIDRALRGMVAAEELFAAGAWIVEPALWRALRQEAFRQITDHHAAHPEQAGLPLAEFRAGVSRRLRRKSHKPAADALTDSLVTALAGDGVVCANGQIRHRSHTPAAPPRLRAACDSIRRQLLAAPFNPPSRAQLCGTDPAAGAMRFLIATGAAIDLGGEVVIAAEAYASAVTLVRSHLSRHGAATVSQLKSVLGSNRRVMIPLLEKLDRDGITRRAGDLRRLPPAAVAPPPGAAAGRSRA